MSRWDTEADAFGVKPFFDLPHEIPVDRPVVCRFGPRPAHEVNGRVGEFASARTATAESQGRIEN